MDLRRGLEKISSSPSRSFLVYCGCFIIGVFCFSWVERRGNWLTILYSAGLIILFFLAYSWKNKNLRLIFLGIVLFVLGVARVLVSLPRIDSMHISSQAGVKKELTGAVVDYPIQNNGGMRYYFQPDNYRGKILVFGKNYPKYEYGDRLKISCVLNLPENKNDRFRYDRYLLRYGAFVTCYNPQVESLSSGGGSFYKKYLSSWRDWLENKIGELWGAPESALLAGILYGDSSSMPAEVNGAFSRAGITHIVAVSGYNTSIVVMIVMGAMIFAGLYRRQAFWAANLQLFLFVIFTGASASVVRAAIMSSAVLLSEHIGRASRSLNILMLTAAIMVLINPFVLVWDIGFQLSFLATIGIVYVSPIIGPKLSFIPDNYLGWLKESLSTTLSAIVMTLPLIIYQFGRLSLVAPVANILILWIIPVLMLLGAISLLIGAFSTVLAYPLAWLSYLGLRYVIFVAEKLGNWTWASLEWQMPGWGMVGMYLSLAYYIISIGRTRNKIQNQQ